MRILLINHFPLTGSGSGVYTANIAKSLTRKGNDVAVIFPENRKSYEKYEGIKLYPIFFKDKENIDDVNQLNINFPCFTTHPRSTVNFNELDSQQRKEYENAFKQKISDVIKKFKPDIVHVQHIWILAGISAEICEKNNIPMIVTCHGTDLMGIEKELAQNQYWGTNWAHIGAKYAKKVITISNDSNYLAEKILPETKDKTIKIKNGVDNNVFFVDRKIKKEEVLKSLSIKSNYDKIVCFVGKLTEFKGVDVLLNAARIYEEKNVLTIIAGDGELREKLKKQSENLKLNNIKFIGNQSQDKLREIYNIANCSCVPSRREPFGLVALEAMICGTPVVATNEGGLPDFVTPDVGILVDVENSRELGEKIKEIIDNKRVFDRNKISNIIKQKYSQDMIIDKIINLYNECLKI